MNETDFDNDAFKREMQEMEVSATQLKVKVAWIRASLKRTLSLLGCGDPEEQCLATEVQDSMDAVLLHAKSAEGPQQGTDLCKGARIGLLLAYRFMRGAAISLDRRYNPASAEDEDDHLEI